MISELLLALAPIALLIGLGQWFQRRAWFSAGFWTDAERLSYYILLPALFVHGLATAKLEGVPVGALVAALLLAVLPVSALLWLARRRLGLVNAAYTSVFQGSIRFNSYVGASVAVSLYGAEGIALAAVTIATLVPTVNVLCVLVFARTAGGRLPGPVALVRQVFGNPLVSACAIGIALHLSGLGLPPGVDAAFKALGQASLPIGLLCVGSALQFGAMRAWLRPICLASAVKFLILPLATFASCWLLGLHGSAAMIAMVFQALPTASSSYILARQLGGDAPLMAGIIAAQTLLAALTLPLATLAVLALG